MERVHYRRYAPSQLHGPQVLEHHEIERPKYAAYAAPEAEVATVSADSGAFIEKLIVQGIISGIMFAVVLMLLAVDNPWAINMRGSLQTAISGHITAEQAAAEVRRFMGEGENLAGSDVSNYIDDVPEQPAAPDDTVMPLPVEFPEPVTRIDEDILNDILGHTEGDDLQTTAPGPMIMPEL